jgi:hypothetical protein
MSKIWELKPLIGVGPLHFGMSRDEVATLESELGPIYAEFTENGPDNEPILQQARDMESPVLYFKNENLTGIQLDRYTKFNIVFGNTSVFGDLSRDTLFAFEKANGGAFYGLGAILFPKLSVSTNGFFIGNNKDSTPEFWEQASDNPPKVLNMEMEGAYERFLNKYTPMSFLK